MMAKKLTEVQHEQGRAAMEEGAEQEDAGVRQIDLMRWYLDTQTKRCGAGAGRGRVRGGRRARRGAECGAGCSARWGVQR